MIDESNNEFDDYQLARDTMRATTGGLVIESTTDGDNAIAAFFQPLDKVGPTVTVAQRGTVDPDDGTTEHSEPVLESYELAIPGKELKADHVVFARRAESFKQDHSDFVATVGQDIAIPIAVERVVMTLENGPQVAHFLGKNPQVCADLCGMGPLDAVWFTRSIADSLERGNLDADGSYANFRDEMNRREAQRRARRARNG